MQRATGKGGFIKPPPLRWIRRASRIGSPAAGYAPGAWSAPADGGSAAVPFRSEERRVGGRAFRFGDPSVVEGPQVIPFVVRRPCGGERKIHFMFVVEYPDQDVRRPLFPVKDHLDVGRHR